MTTAPTFQEALTSLINRYSMECASDTPDFILAQYVQGCLGNFSTAIRQRDQWYGHKTLTAMGPGMPGELKP